MRLPSYTRSWFSESDNSGYAARLGTSPIRLTTIRVFRHYVPIQLVVLAVIEAAVLFASVYAGTALPFVGGSRQVSLSSAALPRDEPGRMRVCPRVSFL